MPHQGIEPCRPEGHSFTGCSQHQLGIYGLARMVGNDPTAGSFGGCCTRLRSSPYEVVWMAGFEPAFSCIRNRWDTKLPYTQLR